MTAKPSPVFVSHGAPTLIVEDTPARHFLAGLAERTGRPEAIVVVSAHWETRDPQVGAPARFGTIHDFYGFPRELYQITYAPPGHAGVADRVAQRRASAGFAVTRDDPRGLDHGAWVPLKLAFPAADVPVVSLSIQHARGPAHHIALGRALAGLAEENVWVLGSGSTTHNLAAIEWGARAIAPWAREFDTWLWRTVAAGDDAALADYRARAPYAVLAHPRDEHLLPLLVAYGAAGAGAKGGRIHESFIHGTLSMTAFEFT